MGRLKVKVDENDKDVQIYGTHKYHTTLGLLYKKSPRKYYPDLLSEHRTEDNIKDAIKNYNNELDEKIAEIRAQYH